MIASILVALAASMVATAVIAGVRQARINAGKAIATEAVQSVFERMRNEDFGEAFAIYNSDPFDDPNGPGTAPGDLFAIPGLEPLAGAPGGAIGQVVFPVVNTGGVIDENWELREDMVFPELGLPRDISGDGVIDALDHSNDYTMLPVSIVARWRAPLGPRTFRMQTLLVNWNGAR